MPSFNEAVQESGRLALCALFATNEAVNALISPIAGDSLGLYPLTSGLRRKLCSDDPANDPTYEPPFSGGQCPDTRYLFTWDRFQDGAFIGSSSFDALGPLNVVRQGFAGPGDPPDCGEGGSFTTILMTTGGAPITLNSGCNVSISNLYVSPLFGGSDDCGDPPPPPLGEPTNVEYGDEITYNIDESTDITVPINFIFAPVYVDLDGSINVPVTFDVGGVNFNGELTVSPEFNFEFSPTIGQPGPGSPDDPDGIGEPGGGAEPIENPEDLESTIVGVLVYSDIDSEADPSGILFVNGPDLYVPRVASVQFAIKTKDSIGRTPDQDVKNLECYVPCPAPQGAIAVRVSPMPGVQSRFTAVRSKPLTTF